MVTVVIILAALILLALCGTTTLSRTSRAAAYVTCADLMDGLLGRGWEEFLKRDKWPKHLFDMVITLLIHALGVLAFFAMALYGISLVFQKFGLDIRELLS